MTMTEARPSTRSNGQAASDGVALSEQLVLSGAGFTSNGITSVRRVAMGAAETVDTIVLGTLDIAEKLVDSNLVTDVATKTISVARQAWTIGMDASRDALNDF